MSDEDEKLDPALEEVVRAARGIPPAPGKARVRARLDVALPAPLPAPVATGIPKLAATFLLGGAVGAAVLYAVLPAKEIVRVVEVVLATPDAAAPVISASVAPPVVIAPVPSVSVPVRLPAPSASVRTGSDLDAERILLDPGRTALGRHEGQRALEAVRAHEKRFPNGALVEEREAIAVQALVLVGRKDEAAARGARFLTRYPGSVLRPVVESALQAP